ncbi:RNA polymerase sigma factor [Paludisphaera soli]|uniref:RNA polymerase sigma factor n=1 Tax=Paludisphaera soli TaxID=2712865 RepID=UPI0036F43E07
MPPGLFGPSGESVGGRLGKFGPVLHGAEKDEFAALVRPFLAELVRVARRQLGCDHLAWEAVQDALLGLWSRAEAPANPRAWLIRAVLYRSLHLRRTMRRRHKHEGVACNFRREAIDRDDPAQALIVQELRAEVRTALERLGPRHRDVLSLHLIDGLDYESIGRRLGVPIGTVRSRLSRAREALKAQLDPDAHDRP